MADISIQNCKKCQLPINEGHAYELGDHRWHISCFKCSKCDNSLGCNSNFLVLGNGNLICSNCSYNCKQCDKKIDDLAILTGDQAYCTNCFKCRACKQKIEDLKYARTSKGLFCMNCHEKLINKKKKYDAKKKQYIIEKHSTNQRNSLINGYLNNSYQNLSNSSLNTSPQIFNHLNLSNSSVGKNLPNLPEKEREGFKESIRDRDSKGSQTQLSHRDSKESNRDSFQSALTADSLNSLINFNESPQISNPYRVSNDFSIEEINDSDTDEIPLKRAPSLRQKLNPALSTIQKQLLQERKLAANVSTPKKLSPYKSDDNGSIFLDIIDTPSNYQSPSDNVSPINQLAPPVDLTKKEEKQEKHDELKVFDESPTPPHEHLDPNLSPNNKNVLLLSPNQFHDHEFHTASMELSNKKNGYNIKPPSKSPKLELRTLEPPPEDPKSRSGASSPFARANRQARVVESNDYVSTDTLDVDVQSTDNNRQNSLDNSLSTTTSTMTPTTNTFSGATPKRKPPPNDQFTSPPPKLPLPSTPTIKSLSKQPTKFEDPPKGLGLQGIEFYNEKLQNSLFDYDVNPNQTPPKKKSNNYLPQTVTNLEDVLEKKDEDLDSQSLSRVSSIMRTPKLSSLKHKRSISGGSNSLVNKFGFFRSNKDDQRGHGRHVSDSSISGNEILHNVPLGASPQFHINTVFSRDHIRSTSDTGVHTIEQFNINDTKEYQALKEDISELTSQKQSLDSEVKRLYNEKYSLTEQTKIMQLKLSTFNREHESLIQEIADLKIQKKKYLDINQSLSEQNHSLEQSWISYQNNNSSSNSTLPNAIGENIRKVHSESSSVTGSTVYQQSTNQTHSTSSTYINEMPIEEPSEPQRAARLKFWKRKGGTGNQANLVNISETYNNNKSNSSNNMHTSSSLGKQTSFGSLNENGDHHNNNSTNNNNSTSNNHLNVEKKNKFVKSRSTNILDSFLNGSSGSNISVNNNNNNNSGNNNNNNNSNSNHHHNNRHTSHNQPKGNSPNKDIPGDYAPLYTSTIQQRADYEKTKVPLIITKCIDEVENRGLDTEGIYRISGGNSAIVAIENSFASLDSDNKSLVKLDEVLDGDINAVTSALKRYLRKLPEPLIPYSLYDEFIKVSSTNAANKHEKRANDLKVNVLTKLPPANKHALFLLCKHLVLIDSYSSINRMGFKNLSVVFAPTIARDKSGEREMLDMGYRNNVIELLLTNAEQLFDDYPF